ncbi:MAG TPA: Tm-1-like ATP-binding domain-containing protein [Devosia sp.]|nr:Tm-1-like ATP-binding domain-containing protein [Devosia sp.]
MDKTIAVLATLDTKGEEAAFVAGIIRGRGYRPLLVDCGIKGEPLVTPDVTRDEIAAAAGTSIAEILARNDKNAAIEAMASGAARFVAARHAQGQLAGILGMGGVQGTVIATRAMQALPVGVPKMMLSAVANGQAVFGPYVGSKDVTIMHSVADIMGLNMLTRQVMAAAAGAVTGMCDVATGEQRSGKPVVGMTMAGVTNPTAMAMGRLLEGSGYEVIGFHCNGIGAKAMEELVDEGKIDLVLDLSPHDIGGLLRNGLMQARPDRLGASVERGVPIVFVPGALDFILRGPIDGVPADLLARQHVRHNPIHTHIRASRAEMEAAGRFVGERLARSPGPVRVVIPEGGFSQFNVEGGPLRDAAADAGFAAGLREALSKAGPNHVEIVAVPQHVNDSAFAQILADTIIGLTPSQ